MLILCLQLSTCSLVGYTILFLLSVLSSTSVISLYLSLSPFIFSPLCFLVCPPAERVTLRHKLPPSFPLSSLSFCRLTFFQALAFPVRSPSAFLTLPPLVFSLLCLLLCFAPSLYLCCFCGPSLFSLVSLAFPPLNLSIFTVLSLVHPSSPLFCFLQNLSSPSTFIFFPLSCVRPLREFALRMYFGLRSR